MPLYKVTPAARQGFISFFNSNSVDGFLGRGEIQSILLKGNVKATSDEIQQVIDSISITSRGINLQAFIDFLSTYRALRNVEHEYAEAFRLYDRQGLGVLSRSDIQYVFGRLQIAITDDKLNALMDQADSNRDGKISYTEFCDLMKRQSL